MEVRGVYLVIEQRKLKKFKDRIIKAMSNNPDIFDVVVIEQKTSILRDQGLYGDENCIRGGDGLEDNHRAALKVEKGSLV